MQRICYTGGRLVDVRAGRYFPETAIWVRDGRIEKLSLDADIPPDAQVIDLGGLAVVPGLFNVHTHIQFNSTPAGAVIFASEPRFAVSAMKNLRKYLDSGVTFIRDMGGAKYVDIEMRDMVREGLIPGPAAQVSGRNLSATGGQSWQNGVEVDGKDACIRAVREQCKHDVDWIKLMASGGSKTPRTSPYLPQLSLEEMRAVVIEATRWDRRVAAHAMGGLSAKWAAMAGVASIDHGYLLDEETLDIMAEKNVAYVPTLAINYAYMTHRGQEGVTDAMADKAERTLAEVQAPSLALARRKGVHICVGNDACSPYNDHDGTGYELMALCEYGGLTPAEALQSATLHGAALCRVEGERGALESGKVADFALFAGDPLTDISRMRDCRGVVQAGRVVRPFAAPANSPAKNS